MAGLCKVNTSIMLMLQNKGTESGLGDWGQENKLRTQLWSRSMVHNQWIKALQQSYWLITSSEHSQPMCGLAGRAKFSPGYLLHNWTGESPNKFETKDWFPLILLCDSDMKNFVHFQNHGELQDFQIAAFNCLLKQYKD